MAICERGYLCEVCGGDVAELAESDQYLRYVLGEVDPETLHACPERHIRCDPVLAQFIVAEGFAPLAVEGPFAKAGLDPAFVASEEDRMRNLEFEMSRLGARNSGSPYEPPPFLAGLASLDRRGPEAVR